MTELSDQPYWDIKNFYRPGINSENYYITFIRLAHRMQKVSSVIGNEQKTHFSNLNVIHLYKASGKIAQLHGVCMCISKLSVREK